MKRNLIKIVAVVLTLALLISVAVLITGAKDNPSFKISTTAGEPGDEVEVTLSLADNPGITGLSVNIGYSADDLELLSIDNAGLFEDSISTSKLSSNPVTISWFALDSQDKSDDGVLAVLKFKIKENASTSEIKLTYDEDNVFNNKFDNISFDITNGKVGIGDDIEIPTDDTEPTAAAVPTASPTQPEGGDTGAPAFVLSTAAGEPGDEAEIKLSLNNNPGITGLSVSIGYSADDLELLSIDNAGLFEDSISTSKLSSNPVTISWFALDSQNKSDSGVLAVLKFKIKENASASDITLTYDEDNVFDNKFNNISFEVENGRISIGSETEPPTEPKPTEARTEPPTSGSSDYIIGDVDGDGDVTVLDSTYIQRYATKVRTPYPIGEKVK